MSDQNPVPVPVPVPPSQPWGGNYNIRGASLTFTNTEPKAYKYYFGLIDFPSAYQFQVVEADDLFSLVGVTAIPNTGQYNYDPTKQYQANGTIVYYTGNETPGFYKCILNTPNPAGPFNASCWEFVGTSVYQLNYTYNDMTNSWPQALPGATIVTYNLPVFTTQADYDPASGPIISMSMTCSGSSLAQLGDPNKRRPPIVNLPISSHSGGVAGTPVLVAFSSLTYQTGYNYWIFACVNTVTAGSKNIFQIYPNSPSYWATLAPGPSTGPVAAVGVIQSNDNSPMGSIAITGSPLLNVPAPMSAIVPYIIM